MKKNFLKFYRIIIFSISMAFMVGCEDDPILDPQDDTDEGGSYGKLSLPTSNGHTDNIKNPKTY
ncbi:MAG TPA: hypothetical protein DDX15_01055 [Gammaproteobacteria bacterium]|nr:hypothetical protein [Gammaproteobacteria bacterium]